MIGGGVNKAVFWRLASCLALLLALVWAGPAAGDGLEETVRLLSASGDRSAGSTGSRNAAGFILDEFSRLGFEDTGRHTFTMPVLEHRRSTITVAGRGGARPLHPLLANVITPETIGPEGLSGPLVWVGTRSDRRIQRQGDRRSRGLDGPGFGQELAQCRLPWAPAL